MSQFFNTLVAQGSVPRAVFSFSLKPSGSELYLGGVNPSKYKGPITFTPVTQQAYWQVRGSTYVNGRLVNSPQPMIIDSGTTLIVAPPAAARALFSQIPGASLCESSTSSTRSRLTTSTLSGYFGFLPDSLLIVQLVHSRLLLRRSSVPHPWSQ